MLCLRRAQQTQASELPEWHTNSLLRVGNTQKIKAASGSMRLLCFLKCANMLNTNCNMSSSLYSFEKKKKVIKPGLSETNL